MTDEILKINKRAAELLGCESEYLDRDMYTLSESFEPLNLHRNILSAEEMRFHDSYDWAYLLVNKLLDDNKLFVLWEAKIRALGVLVPSPLQITTACLEVLNG